MNDGAALIALAGLLATVSMMCMLILAYHALQTQRELDKLREIVRGIGLRVGVSIHELPPERPVIDEWAPDAVVDTSEADREWKLPRSLRRD